jgi:transcriptional regulator with GAF, ATPase, and Fis domain
MSSMYDGPRPLVSFSGFDTPTHAPTLRLTSISPLAIAAAATSHDVRVIVATHVDLGDAVRRGAFRADLLDRLRLSMLSLPPLRDRPDDIVPLARYFVGQFARSHGGALSLSIDAEERLRRYRWPGNVRELSIVIERAARRRKREEIGAEELDLPRA